MNKKTVIAAVFCLIILTGGVLAVRSCLPERAVNRNIAADRIAANKIYHETRRMPMGMINGEPFFPEDLAVYAAELRAAVAIRFGRMYNLSGMGADFWDTVYDGITPREFLNNAALNILARNMVLIQQARMRGIDTPDTYSDLEEERAAWNAPAEEIIYGPRTLGPAEYNSYRITGITNALMTSLLHNELAPTIDQLRAAFDSLDDGLKAAPFSASGVRFSWNAGLDSDEIYAAVKRYIETGYSAEDIVKAMSALYPGISFEDFEVDSRFVSKEAGYDIERENILWDGYEGMIFPAPFGEPALYHVTHYEGGGIFSFEEAPGLGRNKWINDQFELFLEKKVRAARITLI